MCTIKLASWLSENVVHFLCSLRHSSVDGDHQNRITSMCRKYRHTSLILILSISYGRFRYWFFRYIGMISVTTEISVIYGYFVVFSWPFNDILKTYSSVSETEYGPEVDLIGLVLIWRQWLRRRLHHMDGLGQKGYRGHVDIANILGSRISTSYWY